MAASARAAFRRRSFSAFCACDSGAAAPCFGAACFGPCCGACCPRRGGRCGAVRAGAGAGRGGGGEGDDERRSERPVGAARAFSHLLFLLSYELHGAASCQRGGSFRPRHRRTRPAVPRPAHSSPEPGTDRPAALRSRNRAQNGTGDRPRLLRRPARPRGQTLLAALRDYDPARELAVASRLRRDHPAELVTAALGQARLRQRAVAKFGAEDAYRMYFTPHGVEQSTRASVGAHRAGRMKALGVRSVADLCSGIGGDAIALARAGISVLAVDRDPLTAEAVRANAGALGLSDLIEVRCADVTEIDTSPYDAVRRPRATRRPGQDLRPRGVLAAALLGGRGGPEGPARGPEGGAGHPARGRPGGGRGGVDLGRRGREGGRAVVRYGAGRAPGHAAALRRDPRRARAARPGGPAGGPLPVRAGRRGHPRAPEWPRWPRSWTAAWSTRRSRT